jgi:hypothetical protein
MKVVKYHRSKILRVTKDGLEYVDDQGNEGVVDFRVCRENVAKEVRSSGWVRVRGSEDVYVGFRDSGAKPPHITLATNPPTRFEFPMPRDPVRIPGGQFLRHDPEDFRDFHEFQTRLMEAGVKTLDMA